MEGWRSNLHVMMVHTCALEHYSPVDWDSLKKTEVQCEGDLLLQPKKCILELIGECQRGCECQAPEMLGQAGEKDV